MCCLCAYECVCMSVHWKHLPRNYAEHILLKFCTIGMEVCPGSQKCTMLCQCCTDQLMCVLCTCTWIICSIQTLTFILFIGCTSFSLLKMYCMIRLNRPLLLDIKQSLHCSHSRDERQRIQTGLRQYSSLFAITVVRCI